MTTTGPRSDERRCGVDPVRRAILTILAIYLIPVALVVFLIGGVGLGCCAIARLIGRGPGPMEGRMLQAGTAHGVAASH